MNSKTDGAAPQSLRGFISMLEQSHPDDVVRVTEPVDVAYQMQALALELERRRRFPVLIFEQVRGHSIPVVSNVMASRRGLATALGVGESDLPETYAARLKEPLKPVVLGRAPFPVDVRRGDAADLGALPIPTYFPGDGGPYLTAGLLIARDPAPRGGTAGVSRFPGQGRNPLGGGLPSRRAVVGVQQAAEKAGARLHWGIGLGV